jgi:DNA ligase 1
LRFRSGRPIQAPPDWRAALPAQPLDGELWLGHGEFDGLSGRVRRQAADPADWRGIQYMVFDLPLQTGPFESRWDLLGRVVDGAGLPWLRRVPQVRIREASDLDAELERVIRIGGEGLMLHRADATWQPGRSGVLFKYKPEQDAEAQVLGYHKGQGRLSGKVGALWVETPEGQRFAVGSGLSDAQRRHPPPVGSWITYRYRDTTDSGLPRFATFVRVRPEE